MTKYIKNTLDILDYNIEVYIFAEVKIIIMVMRKKRILIFFLLVLLVAGYNLIESKSTTEYSDLLFDNIEAAAICEISGGGPTTKCNPESGKKCYIGELVAENCSSYIAR